jgi:hypothetical protein
MLWHSYCFTVIKLLPGETMKKSLTVFILALGVMALPSCSHHKKISPAPLNNQTLNQVNLRDHIATWPQASKVATEEMLSKYGNPQIISDEFLVWNSSGIFKRSVVYKQGVLHSFPTPHTDVLEQTINYKVPTQKIDDLWAFDGSLLLDRTKGEISSRCDQEAMNILALNLADEIIRNKVSISGARKEFLETSRALGAGDRSKFSSQLSFPPQLQTADSDKDIKHQPTLRPVIQAQEAEE